MKLSDTTVSMLSPDYKERFKAEFYQLEIRMKKLSAMLDEWDEGKLNFTPTCPREIYEIQLRGMREYRRALVIRAKIEGIDLQEVVINA